MLSRASSDLRKATIDYVMSIYLSVLPHGTTRWKEFIEISPDNYLKISVNIRKKNEISSYYFVTVIVMVW